MNKRRAVAAVAVVLLGGLLVGAATSGNPDAAGGEEKAIRETVQLYFDGIIKYDEQALRKAFHPDANVIGTTDAGAVSWEPFQKWVVYTRGNAPDPAGRNNRIVSLDLAGRAAVVKTELDWPHVHYMDYLSLLKIDGEWKIVTKTWHREKR